MELVLHWSDWYGATKLLGDFMVFQEATSEPTGEPTGKAKKPGQTGLQLSVL
jgi:hypothetical protein